MLCMDNKRVYKKVHLKWFDHCSYSGWHDIEEIEHPKSGPQLAVIESIGYLVCEDKDKIIISANMGSDDSFGDILVIIKKAIIQRKELKI